MSPIKTDDLAARLRSCIPTDEIDHERLYALLSEAADALDRRPEPVGELAAEQTETEPDIAEATYRNLSEIYLSPAASPSPALEAVARAWAVLVNGAIRSNTISDTRRAAIINWLVTDCCIFISQAHADHEIEAIWNAEGSKRHAEVEQVSVARSTFTHPSAQELVEALQLAVNMLAPHEPPDSRAVSNEFVALAAVSCGIAKDDDWAVIRAALAGVK